MAVLADFSTISAGQPAPQDLTVFCSDGHPFIRAGNLEFLCNGGDIASLDKISDDMAKKFNYKIFPKNTIIFAKSGMSAKLGRVYRLKNPAYLVSHLAAVIPSKHVDPDYLKHFFIKNPPSNLIPNEAYPSIRLSEISNIEVNCPSKIEQERISAILEKNIALIKIMAMNIKLLDNLVKSRFIARNLSGLAKSA